MTSFGLAIYARRKALGFTQKMLAKMSGLTVNHISLVECGQRGLSCDSAERVARCLMARWVLESKPEKRKR